MKASGESPKLAKKGERELTAFFGKALLYDFYSGSLDEERRRAVQKLLDQDPETQKHLIHLMNGLKYGEVLSEVTVSEKILQQIEAPETYFTLLAKKTKFASWPQSLKWALEAMTVVVGIVAMLVLVPWDKALRLDLDPASNDLVLAEAKRSTSTHQLGQNQNSIEKPEFQDEAAGPQREAKVVVESRPQGSQTESRELSSSRAFDFFLTPQNPQTFVPLVVSESSAPVQSDSRADLKSTETEKITRATAGTLYRGTLKITNAAAASMKFRDQIIEFGGRKAGEVELGWKKSEGSFYYHFTIPEAKYQDLIQFISEYATPEVIKEPHPRVMPDGIIRIILQVEERM